MKFVKNTWLPDSDTHFENIMDDEGNYQKKQFDTTLKYIALEQRGLFIDVGAHVGLWSRMAIKNGFREVLCLEPNEENFKCLQKNLTKICKTIECGVLMKNFGLSDKYEEIFLKKGKDDNSGSISCIISECDKCGTKLNDKKAKMQVFDDYFDVPLEFAPYYINNVLIKIDVQGYETKVIHGMTDFIKAFKPIIIIEQWLDGKEDLEATRYCESLGMKILETIKKEVILGW